jgi:hypothetical protein
VCVFFTPAFLKKEARDIHLYPILSPFFSFVGQSHMQQSRVITFVESHHINDSPLRHHITILHRILLDSPISFARGTPTNPIHPLIQRILDITPDTSWPEPYRWWHSSIQYAASAICFAVKTAVLASFSATTHPDLSSVICDATSPYELPPSAYHDLVTKLSSNLPRIPQVVSAYIEECSVNVPLHPVFDVSPPAHILPLIPPPIDDIIPVAVHAYVSHMLSNIRDSPRSLFNQYRAIDDESFHESICWLHHFISQYNPCDPHNTPSANYIAAAYLAIIIPATRALDTMSRVVARASHRVLPPPPCTLKALSAASPYAWTVLWQYVSFLDAHIPADQ